MTVCLIPARGGSKRIPRKNILKFAGRPMIAWSIAAAHEAGCFERIIVSTDDDEIAEIATAEGAEVPFRRPVALSDDHATTVDVIRHALDWLEESAMVPDTLCCLYATAPFVRAQDIRAGADMLKDAQFAIPVTSFGFPIQRAVRIEQGRLAMFDPQNYATRSQDLEEAYHDAGQFYWGRSEAWRGDINPFGAESAPILLPRWRVQDIDTPEDWVRAELMFQALSSGDRSTDGSDR
ncbi:pseudaminic acid cytidylyltransferase [Oceaniovalibus sp. ACAM 378]|uniref:pseudaminic acid cytidylyltransferase n=1 Tax=Oceaniovalibus sp. ACAM 378 TaxID=2599923 RepID=UPI0011D622E2|nr:pseudaminic acid cytidylyltransferase [Oceaniovalibus sp. ACAM 378]TYB87595.1 pseudaminic acid cytidylyltransferase [Oceaniovalibus sp. ACAM 378]